MNYSGIVVICKPEQTSAVVCRLAELSGVEVHHQDASQGKIIVVQEAESVDAEMEGVKRIRRVAGVILAVMMYHYFEDDPRILDGLAARAAEHTAAAAAD
jgi:nitrate reductase NapD